MKEGGLSSMKGRVVSRGGHGLRLVGGPVGRVRWGLGGVVPVIHPVARGGPVCLAVLGGSIKWAAVLCERGHDKRRARPSVPCRAGAGSASECAAAGHRPT